MNHASPSKQHFHADGNLFLRVENTVYKVFRDLFVRRSEPMATILATTKERGSTEGTCEQCPLVLSNVKAEEFDILMDVMWGPDQLNDHEDGAQGSPALELPALITLLKLAKTWEIGAVSTLATRALEKHSGFDPQTKLVLATKYRISHWFRDAVSNILTIPSPSLCEGHVSALGGRLVAQLIHAEFQIHRVRMAIALTRPPLIPDGDCPDPAACTSAWESTWTSTMHAYLVEDPKPLHSLVEEFPLMLRNGEICYDCGDQIVDKIIQQGVLLRERATIEVAVEEICLNFGFSVA